MRYEVKRFDPPGPGRSNQPSAEQKASAWLNEIAKQNGRVVAMTAAPISIDQYPGVQGAVSNSTVKNAIIIIAVFD